MTLAIPQKKDPAARLALLAMAGGVVWCLFATVGSTTVQPAEAQAQIIIDATPTLQIIEPQRQQDDPVLALALPTVTPEIVPVVEAAAPTADSAVVLQQQATADALAQQQAQAQADAAAAAQRQADAAAAALAQQQAEALAQAQRDTDAQLAAIQEIANDPAQNGDSISPYGCPFPIINGRCANGVLAKTIDDPVNGPAFGSKSTVDTPDPSRNSKERP